MVSDHPSTLELAAVRRFEAVGFRAWPAASVHYDGTWIIRLTAGHPAKRLNSVNPLDPGDMANVDERIARAAGRFSSYGRPLTFRMSPLSGGSLEAHLDRLGWSRFSESLVMQIPLTAALVGDAIDQIPLRDVGRFTGAALEVHGFDPALRAGLSEIINAIQPEAGLFVAETGGVPVSTLICVHDGDLAGVFEVGTALAARDRGHARRTLLSAMKWARLRGARRAWLQVEADNAAAIHLYSSMGFDEVYRYHYRRPPEADR
jgi:ribosomal protein S18 acetylase RimI-like enzyme